MRAPQSARERQQPIKFTLTSQSKSLCWAEAESIKITNNRDIHTYKIDKHCCNPTFPIMASPTTVTLASTSPLKRAAVAKFFNVPLASVNCVSCDSLNLPPQPIDSGEQCALARLEYLESLNLASDYLVAIENDIQDELNDIPDEYKERCHAIVKQKTRCYEYGSSVAESFDSCIMDEVYKREEARGVSAYRFPGISTTVGSVVHSVDPTVPADDWIGRFSTVYQNREQQIYAALMDAMGDYYHFSANILASKVAVVPDFPKPGVSFKDLSALISHGPDLKVLNKLTKNRVRKAQSGYGMKFNKVVGLDARGFIYGSALASYMEAGFVMARKAGKLPGDDLVSVQYTTEYSRETLQMRRDAIQGGDQVVVCDDLVATGGSLKAACDLVSQAGGKVVACVVMLAVEPLLEQARALLGDIPLIVVLPECVAI